MIQTQLKLMKVSLVAFASMALSIPPSQCSQIFVSKELDTLDMLVIKLNKQSQECWKLRESEWLEKQWDIPESTRRECSLVVELLNATRSKFREINASSKLSAAQKKNLTKVVAKLNNAYDGDVLFRYVVDQEKQVQSKPAR
jgi:hypothetical protein